MKKALCPLVALLLLHSISAAEDLLETAGVAGGLVVQVGCADTIPAAGDGYLLQVLVTDAKKAAAARDKRERCGPASVRLFDGRNLPYIDNLVNLLILQDTDATIDAAEIARVLAPRGVVLARTPLSHPALAGQSPDGPGSWTMLKKKVPPEIDDWTHYMHDASGNAVSGDTVVGPPRRLQWVGSPRWGRHHEHMSSVIAVVSARGRVFYIIDEGSKASIQLPAKWKLVARDAFSGTVLWKRDIPTWYTHLYPLKSGPALLPRRLVAVGDTVYVTLGIDRPLVALDAATGETIRTYADSTTAEEIIAADGDLFMVVNAPPETPDTFTWPKIVCWDAGNVIAKKRAWQPDQISTLRAVKADTEKELWRRKTAVAPISLCVDEMRAVFHDGTQLVCLDRKTGENRWTAETAPIKQVPTWYAPTVVIHKDVVLFAKGDRKLIGFSAVDGKKLWEAAHHRAGHRSPEDVLVVGGMAWTGRMAGGGPQNQWTGYDVQTGEKKKEFMPDIKSYWFHHRCHRSKATVNFLMPSRTGIEYVDWRRETWDRNHWVRGACIYGVMPANGLTYAPQHPCACYIETKLNGFNALAPAKKGGAVKIPEDARREKGPAYGAVEPTAAGDDAWPTHRHDAARSGYTQCAVPAKLAASWKVAIGSRPSAVTVAGGRCFVAAVDRHTIYALDAESGKEAWRFTAGGRVDSPPTIYKGRAIFGCADGYVYCLRAADGAPAWRYLAAFNHRQHTAFEQVESVWPLHGSVLIQNGTVYCVAGRSVFLDGGMRLCLIDAETGRLVSETIMDEKKPGTDENFQATMRGLNMPPGLPDILSSDGEMVYMRSQKFDLRGKRTELFAGNPSWKESVAQKSASAQTGAGTHLFASNGFLDGSWFHRAYWMYGQMVHNGCNFWFRAAKYAPSGRIMVVDEERVYSYGRLPHLLLWTPALEYRLYAADKEIRPPALAKTLAGGTKLNKQKKGRWIFDRTVTKKLSPEELSAVSIRWSQRQPDVIVRAMVKAGDTLFVAGPPDVLDEEEAYRDHFTPAVQEKIRAQDAALLGKKGGILRGFSAESGEKLLDLKLDAMPAWDALSAAGGRLYLAATDGTVRCFAGGK